MHKRIFFCKIFNSFTTSTELFPHLIISNGNFSNRDRFFLEIRCVVAIIVEILLHDWMIFDDDFIVPRESNNIRTGFLPVTYLTFNIGLSVSSVFLPIRIPSTFARNL